ncbi:MAG: T9SS type A sorting domain-containing protein [Bacteroidota bacterium]
MTKNKSRPLTIFLAVMFMGSFAQAQQSANTSGGMTNGSGGTISYSIGQIGYITNTGSSYSITEGVQHPYEIFTAGIKNTTLDISLFAFPNPTMENLTLQLSDIQDGALIYQLCDIQGKLLTSGQITSLQTTINTSSLPSATYFVSILSNQNQKLQTFQIIKN